MVVAIHFKTAFVSLTFLFTSPYSFLQASTSMFPNAAQDAAALSNIMNPPVQPDYLYPHIQGASIYHYEALNIDKVYERLFANGDQYKQLLEDPGQKLSPAGVIQDADKALLTNPQIKQWFIDICKQPQKRFPTPENAIPKGIIGFLTRMRCTWPQDLLLPVFDLLRVVSLHHKGAETICKEPSLPQPDSAAADGAPKAPVVHAPLSIVTLFKEYVNHSVVSDSPNPESTKLPPKAGAKLMCGRIAVNLFATPNGAKFITDPARLPLFVEGALSLLNESYPVLIQAGACLLQNITITEAAEKENVAELNESGVSALSLAIKTEHAKFVSAKSAGVPRSVDTLVVLTKALGVLLFENEIGTALFSSLDPETSCQQELEEINKSTDVGDAAAIAGEIGAILGA